MNAKELAALTPEQKRVKISEACGKHQYFGVLRMGCKCTECGKYFSDIAHDKLDYLSSLDAMHEAENYWIGNDHTRSADYLVSLRDVCQRLGPKSNPVERATAAQRADAFLLTLPPVSREQPQKTPA